MEAPSHPDSNVNALIAQSGNVQRLGRHRRSTHALVPVHDARADTIGPGVVISICRI